MQRWHQSTGDNQLVTADLMIDSQLKGMQLASIFSVSFVGLSAFFIIIGESAYKPSVHDISLPYFFLAITKTMLSIFALIGGIWGLIYCAGILLTYSKDKKQLASMAREIQQKEIQQSVPRMILKDFGLAVFLTLLAVLDGWLLLALLLQR